LDKKRARNFVGIDNLTAQMPLIEVIRKQPFHIRIWVAYNYERTCGTYVAVYFSGMVKTITVYSDGKSDTRINRPADR
jgi:hypothetical protein